MGRFIQNSLDDLDDETLYRMLGEAWNAQFGEPWFAVYDKSNANYLETSADIGRREFAKLSFVLRERLSQHSQPAAVADVNAILKQANSWTAPAGVVEALAKHQGIVRPNIVFLMSRA